MSVISLDRFDLSSNRKKHLERRKDFPPPRFANTLLTLWPFCFCNVFGMATELFSQKKMCVSFYYNAKSGEGARQEQYTVGKFNKSLMTLIEPCRDLGSKHFFLLFNSRFFCVSLCFSKPLSIMSLATVIDVHICVYVTAWGWVRTFT